MKRISGLIKMALRIAVRRAITETVSLIIRIVLD